MVILIFRMKMRLSIVHEPKGGPEGARSLYLQFRTKF